LHDSFRVRADSDSGEEVGQVTTQVDTTGGLASLESLFENVSAAQRARAGGEEAYQAIDRFWNAVYTGPHLTPRIKELVLLALHASSSALNSEAVERHARRSLSAGASKSDVVDVLTTIIPLANHSLYTGIPVLLDELRKAGRLQEAELPPVSPEVRAIRENFISSRGYWTAMRDTIGQLMPTYFTSFINACMEPWRSGSLSPVERELMYIAIDCSISHTYEPGMRMHIQNALRYGATRDQILEVFQLAALLGIEGYLLGVGAASP
jgi:alkylhydroperoxidase/carboxymuconolactone decarboxylase family protein YurZ